MSALRILLQTRASGIGSIIDSSDCDGEELQSWRRNMTIFGARILVFVATICLVPMIGWSSPADNAQDGGTDVSNLPKVGSGTTTCTLMGNRFDCPYIDYRTPIDTVIRKCYWSEFGSIKHSIPCG